MAVYKVPQDVEAEDKLLGPFTFRQFIYLMIVAAGAFLAYGLSQLFWGLALLPLPVIGFFLILALPLKKDQPMETYLTAVVRFWLKPRTRRWDPEGNVVAVEITAPTTADMPLTKDFTGAEASQRLSYLAQIVDTGGWASRGLTSATDNLHLSDTLVAEAQTAEDIFDTGGNVTQNFDTMIGKSDVARKEAMMATMQAASSAPAPLTAQPVTPVPAPVSPPPVITDTPTDDNITFNPYPSNIHQRVISPSGPAPSAQPVAEPQKTQAQASSDEPLSPDIMRLATNNDLSISTIAREAQRLHKKHLDEGEVVVSLR